MKERIFENISVAEIGREEVLEIQKFIDRAPDSLLELKEIIGEKTWNGFRRPRKIGQLFKELVDAKQLNGIRFSRKASNKHLIYEIVRLKTENRLSEKY